MVGTHNKNKERVITHSIHQSCKSLIKDFSLGGGGGGGGGH